MSKNDVEEVHFKCPKPLFDEFNEWWKGKYDSFSAAIRDLMRKAAKET